MNIERRDVAPAIERRVVLLPDDLRAEARAEGDATPARRRIVGHAAVFDSMTTLYEGEMLVCREVVRKGAFANVIKERQDVCALFNHDSSFILGRTTSGTLTLSEDATGLLTDTNPPDTQLVRDLVLAPIDRRDVSQMSFAFTVRRAPQMTTTTTADGVTVCDYGGERVTCYMDGNRHVEERELLDLDLFDISPVTYPAYKDTDVALRERGERREAEIRGRVLADRQRSRRGRLERMRQRLALAR
jgi:uncharacterized protein